MSKSPKTNAFADGLIERTSSVLREIESKTMHTDKEGDQCRKKSIVCRGVSTPHFKIIPPIFKIPHPPFSLWCLLVYHPPPPQKKKKTQNTCPLSCQASSYICKLSKPPPFRQFPLYIGILSIPLKIGFFSEPPY